MISSKTCYAFLGCVFLFTPQGADAGSKQTIAKIGDYMQIATPVYALGMTVNEPGWEGTKEFAYSFGAMEATVYSLKYTIKERRPNRTDNHSFPSGHTASAFSGATFVHKRYGIKKAIVPYAMAGFTGFSRIVANKHYWWDTVAGAAISTAISWMIVDRYDGTQVSVNPQGVSFKTEF